MNRISRKIRRGASWIAVAAGPALLATAAAPAHADSESAWEWTLKVGEELDTNALRVVDPPERTDLGLRVYGSVDWAARPAERLGVQAWARGGARWMHALHDASAAAGEGGVRLRHHVGRRLWWGGAAEGRTRREVLSLRDFRRLDARGETGGGWRDGTLRWVAWGGWTDFVFRPASSLSWAGPQAGMGLGWDVSDAWRVSVDGSVARRTVRERDIEIDEEGALVWGGTRRRDTWGRTSVRVEHLGERTLVRVGPAVEWNRSSSFGRGYTRTGLSADLTALVWGDLRAHAATRIEWALFVDPALVDDGLLLDDENRNRFLVTLDHPLVGELQVEVRWELHASSVAGDDTAPYRRQLGYVGLVWGGGG